MPVSLPHLAAMHAPAPAAPPKQLGFAEFVTLMAALMAMTALSIDLMLPALPAIGASLDVARANDRQWVISAFILGFGAAQILHGPLSDRFGRRPVLLISLCAGVVCNLLATFAESFTLLLVARVAAGVATASSRVLAISIVRDRVAGDEMARVLSLISIVFMVVPILAPSAGQLLLFVAPWRWIFGVLAVAGALLCLWAALRLPETLNPADRLTLSVGRLRDGFAFVLSNRLSLGYTAASTLMQGALFGFILSVQQIFETEFDASHLFAPLFGAIAGSMAVASFANSRLVMRYGTRAISHRALLGYTIVALIHLVVAATGLETLVTFVVLQSLMMCCFSLAGANFNALAMGEMGKLAGTASSVQGFIQSIGAALIAVLIGQSFDGTTVPLYVGFTLCGLAAFAILGLCERGRFFARG